MINFNIDRYDNEAKMLLNLDTHIHKHETNEVYEYHNAHIQLARKYSLLLNKKLGFNLNARKLSYAALSHDLLKESGLDPSRDGLEWNGHIIPQDVVRYVRLNLDVLEEYALDEFFNTDIQYHALASGIFLRKELNITDKEILYPVMFHSCPIIEVYETLTPRIKQMVDIMMLADKLSSNYLRINMKESEVRIDLDQAVFGSTGRELNYTFGLFLARLIGQGKSEEKQSQLTTDYYYKRLIEVNPFISENYSIKKLGGAKIWPKRESQAWKTH